MNEEQMSVARSLSTWTRSWWGLARRAIAVATAVTMAVAITGPVAAAECRADIDDNGQVNGADLATILSAWGQPGPTDLDGNGITDAADLAVVLAGWGPCSQTWIVAGRAIFADGTPAVGGVVNAGDGDTATIDTKGRFAIKTSAPVGSGQLTLTALATRNGIAHLGDATLLTRGDTDTVVIHLVPYAECAGQQWLPNFGGAIGLAGGAGGPGNPGTFAMLVFDEGNGPALYVGGNFTTAGGVVANNIARWDGQQWSALGTGLGDLNNRVLALAAYDEGSGSRLFALTTNVSEFPNGIARWNGSEWEQVGASWPFNNAGSVTKADLLVFDDGSGPALYMTGLFSIAGGAPGNNIARWNGAVWSGVGEGFDGTPRDLEVFDDGSGPALYASGHFTASGTTAVRGVAKWTGDAWIALGSGLDGGMGWGNDMAVLDDGEGPRLFVGGDFSSAGGASTYQCASWNGSSWRSESIPGTPSGSIRDLAVFDDGFGPRIYAGFAANGSFDSGRLYRRVGVAAWSNIDSFSGSVRVLESAVMDGTRRLFVGHGSTLYKGSIQPSSGPSVHTNGIAGWDGADWSSLGSGLSGAPVLASIVFDDGSGPAIYLAGQFSAAGTVRANNIIRWKDGGWSPLGSGFNGEVRALAVFDDGEGAALVAGGDFTISGGATRRRVALWRDGEWQALGTGFSRGAVDSLAVLDGQLYAGGSLSADGHIARFAAGAWQTVGGGASGPVHTLSVVDDGTGPTLFAGGAFSSIGGAAAGSVAKWDGKSWQGVPGLTGTVRTLAPHHDGEGLTVIAGGNFASVNGVASRVAVLTDSGWVATGGGLPNGEILALLSVREEGETTIYAGGSFAATSGSDLSNIARLRGDQWLPLGGGVSGGIGYGVSRNWVRSLCTWGHPKGTSLVVSGYFPASPAGDSFAALWGCDGN